MLTSSPRLQLIARSILAVFILSLAAAAPSRAQSITADPNSGGTAIVHDGNTYTINGGTAAGANLFHSFQEFGLTAQETAHFLSNPSIRNVLGRVVGGNASTIEGLIRLSGGNSNLYLMNPAGIVFGPGARLDLPGSFAATTATRIGFEDGFFQAAGDNDYAALTGDPTHFVFDTGTGSILNQGILEVANGQSLWLVGGSVLNTGTLKAPGGNVTIAAIPGQHQIRISQENMLLNLVVEALPMAETEDATDGETDPAAVSAAAEAPERIGLQPTDLPRYLTGGSELDNASTVTIAADGTVYLSSNGVSTAFQTGDVGIAGTVEAETVQLMAAGQVTATDPAQVQGKTTVVRFPGETDTLSYNFIDGLIDDPNLFLYGGEAGSISTLVSSQENGIDAITARLAELSQQGIQLDGLRIVSEGGEGNFWLGNAWITEETIQDYAGQLSTWSGALTQSADIMLYSCLTALGESGEALVSSLAEATGADVAASTNLTGSAALGGDWVLEHQTGSIELGAGFESAVMENFASTLQVFTATDSASLIAAIATANGNAQADTINLAGNITLTAVNNMVDGPNGLPSIVADGGNTLTINGMGNTISRDAAAPNFRLMHVALGAELEVNETTLSGGVADTGSMIILLPADSGGAIFNRGTVTINSSTISGNRALNDGGGVYSTASMTNAATVTINNSLITGNTAGDNGGGLANSVFVGGGGPLPDASRMIVNNSTITGNTANDGGGVSNFGQNGDNGSVMTLNNSTITGNTARFTGGGIYNRGQSSLFGSTVILTNSTVTQNTVTNAAGLGGGIFNTGFFAVNSGRVIVGNSIVAQNTATTGPDVHQALPVANAPFVDQGNNLIGVVNPLGLFATSTLVGISDPGLFPLGDYGGPTQTHALRPDSPALNAGSNTLAAALTTDQRGAGRVFGGTVDIGAYESHGFALLPITTPPPVDRDATTFSPIDVSMQVVEAFFSQPVPLEGLSVSFALGNTAVSGSFDSGTVVTNAQGIAVNNLNLTSFAAGFSGAFEVLATASNVPTFTQQVGGASLSVDTFGSSSPVTPTTTPVTSSLDVSGFSGLADLWERRDRAFNCADIPGFMLAEEDDAEKEDDGEKEDDDELRFDENCFPDSPFEAPNRLIDETVIDGAAIDEAVESNLPSKTRSLTGIDAEMGQEMTTIIPSEEETPVISTFLSSDIAVNALDTATLDTAALSVFMEEAADDSIEPLAISLPNDVSRGD